MKDEYSEVVFSHAIGMGFFIEMRELIDRLYDNQILEKEEFVRIIDEINDDDLEYLFSLARKRREEYYGKDVYIRGLIEFTNYCKNDCLYCGIRRSNRNANRYRLSEEQILECAEEGYRLGFRTFVLQGGEDPYFTDERIVRIVSELKKRYPECAVTLSIGEKTYDSYKKYFDAGADRFLLRHETANEEHYSRLHPDELTSENRKRCLYDLKKIGYQVGTGFMVGSPYQTSENLAEDLLFIKELEPDMVGIGPFITHKDTPFKDKKSGTVRQTLIMIALLRLIKPNLLLPATTALGTLDPRGREKGILAGANVTMPNLSPVENRKDYSLYDNKICTGDESAQCITCMTNRVRTTGYEVVISRGDVNK